MKLKTINSIIGSALIAGCLWSCSDNDGLSVLKRDTDAMQFNYLGETKELHVLTNGKWSIVANDNWINCTPTEGIGSDKEQIIEISASQNDGGEREGSVTLTDGIKQLNISVNQENGFFYFDKPVMPEAIIHKTNVRGSKIEIPYFKAKPGYTVNATCEILLDDMPCSEITADAVADKELAVGSGVVTINLSGEAKTKGDLKALIKLSVNGQTYDMEASSKVRAENELTVTVFKLLPKLVVIDWGKYVRGTGTNGDNGTARDFDFELAYEKEGAAIRKSVSSKTNWLVANMFWPENRFVYGNLKPDTDYWFRIVEKNIGENKNETSDVTYLKFHTPAEPPLPDNTVLYNDFDHFCIKGSAIYRAFGIAVSNANVGKNFDPNNDADLLANTGICTPPTTMDPLHDKRNDANHALNFKQCPKVWEHYWETDKYGTDGISNLDTYPGWSCYFARQSTGAVMLGGATTSNAYLGTPRLAALGETPTDITVVVHTAAYHEPYHTWEEDCLKHYIKIDGPGKIVDAGVTAAAILPATADPNSDKSVVVEVKANKEGPSKGSLYDYNVTTEHVIKISGATKDTRIKVMNMKIGVGVPHARLLIDDILITKN